MAINGSGEGGAGRHAKAQRCAVRTRLVCEVLCGLQCGVVGLGTVWIAILNRKADGR